MNGRRVGVTHRQMTGDASENLPLLRKLVLASIFVSLVTALIIFACEENLNVFSSDKTAIACFLVELDTNLLYGAIFYDCFQSSV